MKRIPFNKPFVAGKELYYMAQAVTNGQLAGGGEFSRCCEAWLAADTGATRVLMTPSCTAALEMAAVLLDIEAGDEVLMPSFTFTSTANAFAIRGATPRFVDIREDTLNIDERLLEDAFAPQTRAIVPVHYAGVGADMAAICKTAEAHSVAVIEDAAQGVAARRDGQALGAFGQLGCFSFHETKNFICGEGGALVINDAAFVERAEIVQEKGTDRARFFRGEVDKYGWADVGSSYLMSELTAAFLYAQLEQAEEITARRLSHWQRYARALRPLEARGDLRLPIVPENCEHNAHMFYVLAEDAETRDGLLRFLAERGIQAIFHYIPLHTSTMGERLGYRQGQFPVTEDISARLVRLPCFFELSDDEAARVIEGVYAFFDLKPPA